MLKTSLGSCTLRSSKANFSGRLGPVPGAPQSNCGQALFNPQPTAPPTPEPPKSTTSGEGGEESEESLENNIALNRPTAASSVEGGNGAFSPDRAVDGSPGTRWSSAFADNEWLAIDLGVVYELFAVSIDWEAALPEEENSERRVSFSSACFV